VQSTPTFFASSGNRFVVTYTFAPPGGQWAAADFGSWSITIAPNEVGDYMSVPRYVPAGVVGAFSVRSKANLRTCDACRMI
jgi:hypothetical protein